MDILMMTKRWNVDVARLQFESLDQNEHRKNIAEISRLIYGEIQKSQLLPISSDDHFIATESQPLTNTSQNKKDEVA